ncbi:MAG: alginate export family protein [Candidatus Omnitrophica bacterium]|nr:alginate export family protein [Candidatus Omnitrophota bacterium]
MSKRLILIFALFFVLGVAFTAYAEVQNVKVSGDLEFIGFSRELQIARTAINTKTQTAAATIARVRIDADLTDNVMTTVRLINERFWGSTGDNQNSTNENNTNVDIDLAYVTLKEFLYSPLSLTVGRQELHYGSDMIVGNPNTNNVADGASPFNSTNGSIVPDFSKRKSFDAVRAVLDYNPLVIDLVAAQVRKNNLFTDTSRNLYGINASYAINNNNTVEGYWFEKRLGRKLATAPENKIETTHNLGVRVVSKELIPNLTLQAEGAYQFGTRVNAAGTDHPTQRRSAMAGEVSATYDMKKVKYEPTATLLYNYFSGNREDGNKYHGWDPMYENQTFGNLANVLFNQTNQHQLGGVLTAKPMTDVIVKGEYYAYWWDKRNGDSATRTLSATYLGQGANLNAPTMTQKKFLGQEVDLTATYNYTEDVQFALMGGLFFPGNSFEKDQTNGSRHVAKEVIGSMKVTF